MDAKRRNEGHAQDGGVELPLVVWVDDEPEPGRSLPDGSLPDAAASGEAVSGEAASTEAASAPSMGKVGPVAEVAEIAQVAAAVESALPVPTGVGADTGQVIEQVTEQSTGQGAEQKQQQQQKSEQAAEEGSEAAFSTSAETVASAEIGASAEIVASAADAADAKDSGSAHHRRISRPMIAAAAISGVVLVGLSAVLAQMGGGSSGSPVNPAAALYPRATLGGGFTPGGAGVAGGIAASHAPGKPVPGKGATSGAVAASHGSNHGTTSGNTKGSAVAAVSGNSGSVAVAAGSGATGSTNTGASTGTASANSGSNPPASTPTTAPPTTFTAVGGPGCADTGTSFQAWGWFDDGNSGYIAHDSGGLVGDGCSGAYNALPMSGEAGTDDTDNSMVWTFHTGAVSKGTCAISVYIPDISNVIEVGGDPSYYTVQGSSSPYTDTTGSFEVDQVSHRGDWVSVGTFPVSGGLIAVMLHSRGIDWTDSAATYAHHNADALEVSCVS